MIVKEYYRHLNFRTFIKILVDCAQLFSITHFYDNILNFVLNFQTLGTNVKIFMNFILTVK